jgi:hypothetical protein
MLSAYEEKCATITVLYAKDANAKRAFKSTLQDIQPTGLTTATLVTASDEIQKRLMLNRHGIDIHDLILEFRGNHGHIFATTCRQLKRLRSKPCCSPCSLRDKCQSVFVL